jgi:hypothetical protein
MALTIPRSTQVEALAMVHPNVSASGTIYFVAPKAGKIVKAYAAIDGAIATGNATLTGSINGTAITNGVITVVQAGSAAGSSFSCTPSAANLVQEGDVISFAQGGTSTNTVKAYVTVLIQ